MFIFDRNNAKMNTSESLDVAKPTKLTVNQQINHNTKYSLLKKVNILTKLLPL